MSYTVFYDAQCALCRGSRAFLKRVDRHHELNFVDVNNSREMRRWPEIDRQQALEQISVLDPDGNVSTGFRGVVEVLSAALPPFRVLRPLLTSLPVAAAGQGLYRAVSDRRLQVSQSIFHRNGKMSGNYFNREQEVELETVLRGALAGAIGGAIGSFTLNIPQVIYSEITGHGRAESGGANDITQGEPRAKIDHGRAGTLEAAEKVSEGLLDHSPSYDEKWAGGFALHVGLGVAAGAAYGAAAAIWPKVTAGAGEPYGAFVWLAADEIAMPVFGISEPPHKSSLRSHVVGLVGHFVFGATVEAVRRMGTRTRN